MKWVYELMYRHSFVPIPYDIGRREELVSLVESGGVKPGRAIDLGSGTASNLIYLAQHGFEVTYVDYSHAALEMGHLRAREAGVKVTFIEDDLTNLQHINGTFDLLVDYGTLDELRNPQRDLYMKNVLPLSHQGSFFLLYCFEWWPLWWERPFIDRLGVSLRPGEVKRRFGTFFEIERLVEFKNGHRSSATYLMTRK